MHLSQHVFNGSGFSSSHLCQIASHLVSSSPSTCFALHRFIIQSIHIMNHSSFVNVFSLRIMSLPSHPWWPTWLQFHDGQAHAASLHCGLPQRRHVARQLPLDAIQDLHLQCHARTALAQHQQLARWRGWRFHLDREKGGFLLGYAAIRLYLGRFS